MVAENRQLLEQLVTDVTDFYYCLTCHVLISYLSVLSEVHHEQMAAVKVCLLAVDTLACQCAHLRGFLESKDRVPTLQPPISNVEILSDTLA